MHRLTRMERLAACVVAVAVLAHLGCRKDPPKPPPVTAFPVEHLGTFYQANGHLEMDQYAEAAKLYARIAEPTGYDAVLLANWAAALMGKRELVDYVEQHSAGDEPSSVKTVVLSSSDCCERDPSVRSNSLLPDAERCARRAVAAAPENPDVALVLCAVLQAQGRQDEAVALLRETVAAHPDHAHARYFLLRAVYPTPGEAPSAEVLELQDQLMQFHPTNVALLADAMVLRAQAGDLQAALDLARRVEAIIIEVPPQFAKAIDLPGLDAAVTNGDQADVLRSLRPLKNILKGEDRFRSDVVALGRAGDDTPLPIGHPHRSLSGTSQPAIQAAIEFERADSGLPPVERLALGCVGDPRTPALFGIRANQPGVLAVAVGGRFEDRTADAGLADVDAARWARFVDADNDGLMDLVIMTATGAQVYRQRLSGLFADVTAETGLTLSDATTGIAPFDFDHDGDLDIVSWEARRIELRRNDGEGRFGPPVVRPGLPGPVALPTGRFIDAVAPLDLDDDGDVDLAVTLASSDGAGWALLIIANERMANFSHRGVVENDTRPVAFKGRPLIGDIDNDGGFEIVDPATGQSLRIQSNLTIVAGASQSDTPADAGGAVYGALGDIDNDGHLNVATFANGKSNLAGVKESGPLSAAPHLVDLDQDGRLDVLAPDGTTWFNRSSKTGNWLSVALVGVRQGDTKFNTFGLGSVVEIRAGQLYGKRQATGPWVHFGLGPYDHADVLRVLWPNGNYQHIEHRTFDRMALRANQVLREEQSLKGSCPYLYAWNGERFEFVTDVLWRSALGMSVAMGQLGHHGSADDYFKIAGRQLQPDERGDYVLQFTTELQEVAYFDFCRLLVVDHPAELDVFVDEKCLAPPYPPFEIFKVRTPRAVRALDDYGEDVSDLLAARDGRGVHELSHTRYQGLVEEHDLTLDVGPVEAGAEIKLFLHGWVMPTDASLNVAIDQNPAVAFEPPRLYVPEGDGWRPLDVMVGFPSGKNKTIVVDLTGHVVPGDPRVRLTTTMAVYWDHVWCTVGPQDGELVVTELAVAEADAHYRGFSRAFPRRRHGPVIPQYDAPDPLRVWREAIGHYTRYGDVTPLLTARDSRTVILGGGDEVTMRFSGGAVPALPPGWRRDYVVHTDGWLKDGDLNTVTGDTVEPLPYIGMPGYPYDGPNPLMADPGYRDYVRTYNTRLRDNAALKEQLKPVQ